MKFLVPNYSCLQNPWLRGYRPQIPVLSVLKWICWTPPPQTKFLGTPLIFCGKNPHASHGGRCVTTANIGLKDRLSELVIPTLMRRTLNEKWWNEARMWIHRKEMEHKTGSWTDRLNYAIVVSNFTAKFGCRNYVLYCQQYFFAMFPTQN